MRIIRYLDTKRFGFGNHLINQLLIRRDVNSRRDFLIQRTLQQKQSDQCFATTDIELDDCVRLISLTKPIFHNLGLNIAWKCERFVAVECQKDIARVNYG